MSAIHVGIGDVSVSGDPADVIKTFALGSCVAIIAYDKVNRIAGMMHVALPESAINPQKAREKPGYFADTGMPALIEALKRASATRTFLAIKLAGGSNIMDDAARFDIGKRNVLAIRKLLWKHGLGAIAEDVGGSCPRTVAISVASGEVLVSSGERQWTL